MKYTESKYKFIYQSSTLDIIIMFLLLLPLWAGTFGFVVPGVSQSGIFKLITSTSIVYLIWLVFARRANTEIIFNKDGISIPNTWLPGVLRHSYKWDDINNVEYAVYHRQETVSLNVRGNKNQYIYIKALKAFYLNRPIAKPSEKLMYYLITVLEIDQENNY